MRQLRVEVEQDVELTVDLFPGDGLPFLLVHGLSSNARLWDGVAARLGEAGHPCILVDQRGHGRSTRTGDGYDFATLGRDLARVVDATVGGAVVAVGQSWGGNVVLEFARRYPDLALGVVCIDGGFIDLKAEFDTWESAWDRLAPPAFDGMGWAELRARAAARFVGWPTWAVEAQLANFEELPDGTVRPRLPRETHEVILQHLWNHEPDRAAVEVEVPILVVAVDDDTPGKKGRVERFAGRVPHCRVVWARGHHDLHAERPELVADLLMSFLREEVAPGKR